MYLEDGSSNNSNNHLSGHFPVSSPEPQKMSLPVAAADSDFLPDVVASQNSSPGSASDYMGMLPEHHNNNTEVPMNPLGTARSDASLHAPSWQSALDMDTTTSSAAAVPRVVSTVLAVEPDAVRSASSVAGNTTSTSSSPTLATDAMNSKPAAARRRQTNKTKREPDPTTQRRQKRLERNRESARLSRRRRKQYLEILEERVTQFSHELDSGRREHVSKAVTTIAQMRLQVLESGETNKTTTATLEGPLSRTSQEMSVMVTFLSQQLKSFVLPPSMKFILWLTLQSDAYFRGGRAQSERLSAARIGERVSQYGVRKQVFTTIIYKKTHPFCICLFQMLVSGNDRATPSQSMWPLFCSEVGVSYDQEEKFRNFQRLTLQSPDVWVDRHTTFAATKVVQSTHDALQAVALRLGQKQGASMGILSGEQKQKFLLWSVRNRARLTTRMSSVPCMPDDSPYQTSALQHQAANLYVLNHKMQCLLQNISRAAPLVTGSCLKKLSRRPLFESLGCRQGEQDKALMSREQSFASSGSLKRSASEMSMEGEDRPAVPTICPIEAQATSAVAVENAVGHVKAIIPPPPTPTEEAPMHFVIPAPTPVTAMMSRCMSMPVAPSYDSSPIQGGGHKRNSSFLPSHLNIVPEEMWETEDFLMNLVDEDWAIGEGIDME
jgi:hypothetical protein